MTRMKPKAIENHLRVEMPADLLKEFRRIHIAVDLFYVQGQAYQHTISRRIKFRTVERIKNMTKKTILQSLQKVFTLYRARGYEITQLLADNQYDCMRDDILPILLTIVGAGEHVRDVERSIRTVKEGARTMTQGLPFQYYPRTLVEGIVEKSVKDLNNFPAENGALTEHSPSTLVTGAPKVTYDDCKLELRQYCKIHTHPSPTNTQHTRSVGAIALLPSNSNGGHYFMSLETGARVHSYIWRELPMTRDTIRQVDRRGRKEGQPAINKGGFVFERSPGVPIVDDEDDIDALDDDYESDTDADTDGDHHLDPNLYDTDDDDLTLSDDLDEDQRSDDDDNANNNNDDNNDDNEHNNNANEHSDEEEHEHNEEQAEDVPDDIVEAEAADNEDVPDDIVEAEAAADNADNNNIEAEEVEEEVEGVEDHHEVANAITDNEEDSDPSEEAEEEGEAAEEEDNSNSTAQGAVGSSGDERSANQEDERSADNAANNAVDERSADNAADERSDDSTTDERSANRTASDSAKRESKRKTTRHDYKEANRRGFSFLNTSNLTQVNKVKMAKHITGIIFNQLEPENQQKKSYYWKAGVKAMGDDAVKAIVKEAKQLDDKDVFMPLDRKKLTTKQITDALDSITTVTLKRCGKVKGRTCVDGRKQRAYISRAEASSPTVSLEGLIAIILTASHEERQVLVADIAGAYLNADMDDYVIMKFTDEMVDYMVAANLERYERFVAYEKGKKVLYVRLLKALYGCIQSALLWYKLFTGKLINMGFKLNDYDQCIANKEENGKQCTIGFYVDDLIATHVDEAVLLNVKKELEQEYGEMSSSLGDEHTYLGIDIKFDRRNKTARLSMKGYLYEAIEKMEEIEKLGIKTTGTPAKADLFKVSKSAEKLDERRRIVFHSITALLLYVSKRARPDIATTIAFLCTRPTVADVDDWRKLKRLLQYIRTTIDLDLVIGADSLEAFKTYIDVAYGVHMDMKSHTGGAMTFGRGVVTSKSSKQKINVKSSTEGEVVGMSDYVAFPIWFRYFLEEQGYQVKENIVYQDNQSAMEIEKNGIQSCGQKSRHIKSRYFFIKDRVEQNEIKVEYCPTEKMMADFFTKPLQGELFRRFRDVIMGHVHISELQNMKVPTRTSKERVEQDGNTDPTGTPGGDVAPRSWAEIVRGKEDNEHEGTPKCSLK